MNITFAKYLYKYVYEGSYHESFEVRPEPSSDEVQRFVDARWTFALKDLWQIFKSPQVKPTQQ